MAKVIRFYIPAGFKSPVACKHETGKVIPFRSEPDQELCPVAPAIHCSSVWIGGKLSRAFAFFSFVSAVCELWFRAYGPSKAWRMSALRS